MKMQSGIYIILIIVEQTPLEPWQKHILIRYIDGQNAIITARELAYNFGKMVHPGYTSVVLRSIYAQNRNQRKDTAESERREKLLCENVLRAEKRIPTTSYGGGKDNANVSFVW